MWRSRGNRISRRKTKFSKTTKIQSVIENIIISFIAKFFGRHFELFFCVNEESRKKKFTWVKLPRPEAWKRTSSGGYGFHSEEGSEHAILGMVVTNSDYWRGYKICTVGSKSHLGVGAEVIITSTLLCFSLPLSHQFFTLHKRPFSQLYITLK